MSITVKNVAVVTGAAGGIGARIAERFVEGGFRVALLDSDAAALEKLAMLRAKPDDARAYVADVTDQTSMRATAQRVVADFGSVHALCANAGIGPTGGIAETPPELWNNVIGVNLGGVYNTIAAFVPAMLTSRGRRSIVVTSSIVALRGAGNLLAYSAAKAGLVGVMQSTAQELAPKGITVNALAPGPIRTPMLESIAGDTLDALASEVPLGRLGTPDDIASAAIFLAGDGSSFITGHVLVVDGGLGSRAYWRDPLLSSRA